MAVFVVISWWAFLCHFPGNILDISNTLEYLGRCELCVKNTKLLASVSVWYSRKKDFQSDTQRNDIKTVGQAKIFIEAWLLFCRKCTMTLEGELTNMLSPLCMLFDSPRLLLCMLLLICMHQKLYKQFTLQTKSSQFPLCCGSILGK